MDSFLARCFYLPGQYDSEEDFGRLSDLMATHEAPLPSSDR